eukprot:SAG22_NODE_2_length_61565_cov_858.782010_61_plen_68_part_00
MSPYSLRNKISPAQATGCPADPVWEALLLLRITPEGEAGIPTFGSVRVYPDLTFLRTAFGDKNSLWL